MITLKQLRTAMPQATLTNCQKFLLPLNETMAKYCISTPLRQAHFLCQIAWESGQLRYTEEIASGADYDTGAKAKALGNTPQADGDGQRYRANYKKYGAYIGKDMEDLQQKNWVLLKEPKYAADSAGWFWVTRKLNAKADRDEHTNITKAINGSTATAQKRLALLRTAKIAVGLIKAK